MSSNHLADIVSGLGLTTAYTEQAAFYVAMMKVAEAVARDGGAYIRRCWIGGERIEADYLDHFGLEIKDE